MEGFGASGPGAPGANGALGAAGLGDAIDTVVGRPPGGGGAPKGPVAEDVEIVGRTPGTGGDGLAGIFGAPGADGASGAPMGRPKPIEGANGALGVPTPGGAGGPGVPGAPRGLVHWVSCEQNFCSKWSECNGKTHRYSKKRRPKAHESQLKTPPHPWSPYCNRRSCPMRDLYVLSNLVASTWQKRQATAHVKLIFASVNQGSVLEMSTSNNKLFSLHQGIAVACLKKLPEILLTNKDFIELDTTADVRVKKE